MRYSVLLSFGVGLALMSGASSRALPKDSNDLSEGSDNILTSDGGHDSKGSPNLPPPEYSEPKDSLRPPKDYSDSEDSSPSKNSPPVDDDSNSKKSQNFRELPSENKYNNNNNDDDDDGSNDENISRGHENTLDRDDSPSDRGSERGTKHDTEMNNRNSRDTPQDGGKLDQGGVAEMEPTTSSFQNMRGVLSKPDTPFKKLDSLSPSADENEQAGQSEQANPNSIDNSAPQADAPNGNGQTLEHGSNNLAGPDGSSHDQPAAPLPVVAANAAADQNQNQNQNVNVNENNNVNINQNQNLPADQSHNTAPQAPAPVIADSQPDLSADQNTAPIADQNIAAPIPEQIDAATPVPDNTPAPIPDNTPAPGPDNTPTPAPSPDNTPTPSPVSPVEDISYTPTPNGQAISEEPTPGAAGGDTYIDNSVTYINHDAIVWIPISTSPFEDAEDEEQQAPVIMPWSSRPKRGDSIYWISLGDDYSSTGFTLSGEKPSSENPMGNPAYPGYTTSNGENWIDFVTTKYNSTPTLTYNFAQPQAVCEELSAQVQLFTENYVTEFKFPWIGVASIFMGINDAFAAYEDEDWSAPNPFSDLTNQLVQLYMYGANNVLVFNIPPLDRSPRVSRDDRDSAQMKDLIDTWNAELAGIIEESKAQFHNLNIQIVDTHKIFSAVLNDPVAFGLDADVDTYGSDPMFFWADDAHPSSWPHEILADEVGYILQTTGFWNVW